MSIPTEPKKRRILVAEQDALKWGQLVKSWATSRNYVTKDPYPRPPVQDPPPYPRPHTFKQFVQQCTAVGISLTYDDDPVNPTPVQEDDQISFLMLQGNTDLLIIRLSASEFLEKSEDDVVGMRNDYEIPSFYDDILENANPKPDKVDTEIERLDIHALRVGEYTIAMCF